MLGVMVWIYLKLISSLTTIFHGMPDSLFNVMDESEEPPAPGSES
jgi:hypothetical protein